SDSSRPASGSPISSTPLTPQQPVQLSDLRQLGNNLTGTAAEPGDSFESALAVTPEVSGLQNNAPGLQNNTPVLQSNAPVQLPVAAASDSSDDDGSAMDVATDGNSDNIYRPTEDDTPVSALPSSPATSVQAPQAPMTAQEMLLAATQ